MTRAGWSVMYHGARLLLPPRTARQQELLLGRRLETSSLVSALFAQVGLPAEPSRDVPDDALADPGAKCVTLDSPPTRSRRRPPSARPIPPAPLGNAPNAAGRHSASISFRNGPRNTASPLHATPPPTTTMSGAEQGDHLTQGPAERLAGRPNAAKATALPSAAAWARSTVVNCSALPWQRSKRFLASGESAQSALEHAAHRRR